MKKIIAVPLLGLLMVGAFALMPATSLASNDWRPVTPEELKLTADQVSKDADAAILFSETYIDDSDVSGVGFSEYIRIKVFTDRGVEQASNRHIIFDNTERIKDVRGRTIKPDGTAVELRKEDVLEKSLVKVSGFQFREKTFTMPGVTPGCIVEYRYRRQSGSDLSRFRIDLQQDFFAKEIKVYIKPYQSQTSAGMKWMMFNSRQGVKVDGPKKEKEWIVIKTENMPGLKEEPLMPPDRTEKTWGMLWYTRSDSNLTPDQYWTNFGDSPVGNYYREYVGRNKEIKKVVATVIGPNDDTATKERKLSDFIQREIHNITVADDENAPVKAKDINGADDILKAKRGSPDEINLLYISMLQAAGLDARVSFICSRARDRFRKELTEAFQLTDVLVAVKGADGKYTFFDPGTAFAPFGYISWDKEWVPAIVIDKKTSEFASVPAAKPQDNQTTRSAELSIEPDGVVVGDGSVQYFGEDGISLKRDLYSKSADFQSEHWRKHFAESVPNFTSKDEKIENLSDPEKPLTVRFGVRIPNYASKTGKRLLLQPSVFTRGQKAFFPESERLQDIDFHYPFSEKDHIVFKIPDGYTLEDVPEPVKIDAGPAKYTQSYKVEGNKLIFERELNVNLILVPPRLYTQLKGFFDQVYKADQFTLSIKQGAAK